jgi:hypothetical protein
MAGEILPWTPPESKSMQGLIKYGAFAGIIGFGIYAFTKFAPTMVDAVTLLDTILQDTTHMLLSGAVLVVVAWLLYETFSTTGVINKLLRLPYWMLVNGLTRFFITIDPLSPIDERIKSVKADQNTFETQFERLDGVIKNLELKEQDSRSKMEAAQRKGQAAVRLGNKAAQDVAAHDFGSYREAADSYVVRSEGGIGTVLINMNRHMDLSAEAAILIVLFAVGLFQDFLIGAMRDYIVCPYARIGKRS